MLIGSIIVIKLVPLCGTTKGTTKETIKGNNKRERMCITNCCSDYYKLIITIRRVPFCGTFCSSIKNHKKEQLRRS